MAPGPGQFEHFGAIMRTDIMVWVQRVTGAVFALGVAALVAAVATLAARAETVPPLPIFAGLLGLVALILLAGACMGVISIAISARRGSEALQRLAAQPQGQRLFASPSLREVAPEPQPANARPARPGSGRVLVAER